MLRDANCLLRFQTKVAEKIDLLEKILVKTGKKFAVADEMTVADVHLYCFTTLFTSGWLDGVPTDLFDKYPKIKECAKAVADHPKVPLLFSARACRSCPCCSLSSPHSPQPS